MTEQMRNSKEDPVGIIVCVGGVILQERRVLLVRQAKGHPLEKQWTIPWGFVDPGETPEGAVLREIKEEAGVDAQIEGLLGIQNLPDPWDGWIGIIFQCKHVAGVPNPDGGRETDQSRYFSLHDISHLEDAIEVWCEWLVLRVLGGEYKIINPEPSNPYSPKVAFL